MSTLKRVGLIALTVLLLFALGLQAQEIYRRTVWVGKPLMLSIDAPPDCSDKIFLIDEVHILNGYCIEFWFYHYNACGDLVFAEYVSVMCW